VLEEWLKTPEVSDATSFLLYDILTDNIQKHSPLKAFALKPWPFYRRMQAFMPGTQPRGTYAFDPGSSTHDSSIQLHNIEAEEDAEEDQLGPPASMTFPPAIPPLLTPGSDTSFFTSTSTISPLSPPAPSTSSLSGETSQNAIPLSSSLPPPTIHPDNVGSNSSRHIPT
jgi:hypothetical protein